jgi:hypothetical protein
MKITIEVDGTDAEEIENNNRNRWLRDYGYATTCKRSGGKARSHT